MSDEASRGTDDDIEQDVNELKSSKKGFAGFIENFLRKTKNIGFLIFIVPIIFLYILSVAFAVLPGILVWDWLTPMANTPIQGACLGALAIGLGFFFAILSLLLIVSILNIPFLFLLKPYRASWTSFESIAWFYHNALFYLVRYTVLDFITPTPISLIFLKAMGMKIGKGTIVNTSNISDPCLIRLGDYVTIGGSTFMMAHYAQKGYLIVNRLEIDDRSTVGLNAILMGAVRIGKQVVVAPGSTVLPKTTIPDGARFGYEGLK